MIFQVHKEIMLGSIILLLYARKTVRVQEKHHANDFYLRNQGEEAGYCLVMNHFLSCSRTYLAGY